MRKRRIIKDVDVPKHTFVCFGDVHADALAAGYSDAVDQESGLPAYIQEAQASMQWVRGVVSEYERTRDTTAVFCGDMFHHKKWVSNEAAGCMGEQWRKFSSKIGLPGNHDMSGGWSLLAGWEGIYHERLSIAHRLDYTGPITARMELIPWMPADQWKEALAAALAGLPNDDVPTIVVSHQCMVGSKAPTGLGKTFEMTHGVAVEPFNNPHQLMVLSDIHMGQRVEPLGNVYYTGRLLSRNLNDSGSPSTILIAHVCADNTWKVEYKENPHSPLFGKYLANSLSDFLGVSELVSSRIEFTARTYISLSLPRELKPQAEALMSGLTARGDHGIVLRVSYHRDKVEAGDVDGLERADAMDIAAVVRKVTDGMAAGTAETLIRLIEQSRSDIAVDLVEEDQ